MGKNGFVYDRRFLLLKIGEYKGLPYQNMHLVHFTEMMLFHTAMEMPKDDDDPGKLTVTFKPPNGSGGSIDISLNPDVNELKELDVVMHSSGCTAYDMGSTYNAWFSSCFGYEVIFAYLGPSWRSVLMSSTATRTPQSTSWLSSITSNIPLLGNGKKEEEKITFADCAPYLVVSDKSLEDVSSRLPEGEEMDLVKFRPNIVVSGANELWEEDFWNEIALGEEGEVRIKLAQNCARCASINIDYSTGKPGTGEDGKILKKLMKDRRVDVGAKWSPVFGRYGFVSQNVAAEGKIKVGDEVRVVGRNDKHTVFGKSIVSTTLVSANPNAFPDWPGLSTA